MTPTLTAKGSKSIVADDEKIEAVIYGERGLPAWVLFFGLIGKIAFVAAQQGRMVVVTNRAVRVFRTSPLASRRPLAELASAQRNDARIRMESGKVGRVRCEVLDQQIWVARSLYSQVAAAAQPSPSPLQTAEDEASIAKRAQVLAANRQLVNRRRWMVVASVAFVIAMIVMVVRAGSRDNAFTVAYKAADSHCSIPRHYGDYFAYTTAELQVLVVGFAPSNNPDRLPGFEWINSARRGEDFSPRFKEVAYDNGDLAADVVVCVSVDGSGSLCATGDSKPAYSGSAVDVATGRQLATASVREVDPNRCIPGAIDIEYRDFLCELTGCPVDRRIVG